MARRRNASLLNTPSRQRAMAAKLLDWFERSARDLPWRRTSDLYAIWVSEVMLQQTQVATVIAYYERFLARFPDVRSLAAAPERDVLRLWEGLGYYRRARQLHAAAQVIVSKHDGTFPTSFASVRALPGIGRYTAGAILSIGADTRLPILEANTIRVLSRLTAFRGDPASSAGQQYLWSVAEAILPNEGVGAFNQALMELGSEICTPKSPGCAMCPVATLCEAKRLGLVGNIPRPAKRAQYEDVTECAVVIHHRGSVLLRQCQSGERWAGLWDFPRFAVSTNDGEVLALQIVHGTHELTGLRIAVPKPLAKLKHSVTRFRITLHCFEARLTSPHRTSAANGSQTALRWVAPHDLTDYPLSVTGRRIALQIAPATTTPKKSPASAARRRGNRRAEG